MRRKKDEEREAEERKLVSRLILSQIAFCFRLPAFEMLGLANCAIVMQEEEEKARQAKEEEAAALEFDKWKGEFSVDAEGTTEEAQGENQDLLSEFVEYIKVS